MPTPIGYVIGQDQYFKRDDVGIIFQMNIVPERRRSLVAANLLKAMFEQSAYGCRLFCCWCAQDLPANYFWEALGFVPLAFRTGARGTQRIHIFWQKRIRQGDESTPYWFPSQTSSGSIREDRIVLPIPPGTKWQDAKPIIMPSDDEPKALPSPRTPRVKKVFVVPKEVAKQVGVGGLRFGAVPVVEVKNEIVAVEKKQTKKNDPKMVAAARELRDRWLEQVNGGLYLPTSHGKYDVSRWIDGRVSIEPIDGRPLLVENRKAA